VVGQKHTRRLRFWSAAAGSVILGVTLGAAVPASGDPVTVLSRDALVPPPAESMAEANAAAPFDVKEPSWLPKGVEIEHAMSSGDSSAFSVGIWYKNAAGDRILHIWQTNIRPEVMAEKDPTAQNRGSIDPSVDGKGWRHENVPRHGHSLNVLSRQFEDGVIVSVDAVDRSINYGDLKRIARSLS
jgi:hypothetical protein